MKKVGFFYDDVFLRHETPEFHPENKNRLVSIVNELKNSGTWDNLIHISPLKASFSDLSLVHSERYIEKVRKLGTGYLDSDTYMSAGSIDSSCHAAGAVMTAIDKCREKEIDSAFCAVRPPGHHAEASAAMGFCIFNNAAIGARYAQKIGYQKVFIVDFDVHHGNGSQHIFEDDDTVYFFSTHQYPHYPGTGRDSEKGKGRGEGFTHNIPMQARSGDSDYVDAYRRVLPSLVKGFSPDIMLVSAGYDILAEDPLSSIQVSLDGIGEIVRNILHSSQVPVVFTLEGGYHLHALSKAVRITIEEMLKR
ncbi:MAG TPA: histone deacetylase [Dissulfurispiraceae bacterium]|nr:histone deacetylase [Dissulfurispiraceae bacterium]